MTGIDILNYEYGPGIHSHRRPPAALRTANGTDDLKSPFVKVT